jgi:hypothetical protein
LHTHYIYDLLLAVVGFPASLAWIYEIDKLARKSGIEMPTALFAAICVYITLMVLILFRLLFNYARWVFPRVEGPDRMKRGPWKHRAALATLSSGLFSAAIYDLIRLVL